MTEAQDQHDIRRLITLYAQRYDDGAGEALADLFADDASFVFAGHATTGRQALLEHFSKPPPLGRRGKHMSSNVDVYIDGDHAKSVTDWAYLLPDGAAIIVRSAGRYDDEFVRVDGAWRIARRSVTLLGD